VGEIPGSITKEKFQSGSEALSKQVTAYEDKVTELTGRTEVMENDAESIFSGITELTRELVLEFVTEIKVYTPERIEITWK
jgi:hypothetical protein